MISLITTGPVRGAPLARPVHVRDRAVSTGLSCPNVCATWAQYSTPPESGKRPVAVIRPKDWLRGDGPKRASEPKPVKAPAPSTAESTAASPHALNEKGVAPALKLPSY